MKHKYLFFISVLVISLSGFSFVFLSSNGIAGYTGSPGENTCSNCHGGGSSASSNIVISSTPSFTNNEYVPGTTYTIDITVSALAFSRFGFGCEILNPNNANAGTMQNPGLGVKFLNSGQRKNATHTTAKINTGSATFSFEWLAPQSGQATIYCSGNAVNGNGNTGGDFPLSPVSLALQAAQPIEPPIDPVGVIETSFSIENVTVFPNPSDGLCQITFNLKQEGQLKISICDLNGKEIINLFEVKQTKGQHSKILNFEALHSGVYFLKFYLDKTKVIQKLIIVN